MDYIKALKSLKAKKYFRMAYCSKNLPLVDAEGQQALDFAISLASAVEKAEGSGLVVEEKSDIMHLPALSHSEEALKRIGWNSARHQSLLLLAKNFTVKKIYSILRPQALCGALSEYGIENLATAIHKEFMK